MKLFPPPFLLAGALLFGFGLAAAFFGEDGRAAPCEDGGDCPPCPDGRFCYDPSAARAAKAAKKAAAIASGLPERLAKAFDEIEDCVGCVEVTPDWPHIVIEMDPDGWEEKEGRSPPYKFENVLWSRDAEKRARDMMREGLVRSIHIVLKRYPCRCCPRSEAERDTWIHDDDQSYWEEQDGWNEDLQIHASSVVEKMTDPKDLGDDPPDLTEISDRDKRPQVDLEICGGGDFERARHVTVSCTICMPLKDEHDQYADRINDAQTRLRALRRGMCVMNQVINGIWQELEAVGDLASTAETQAQLDALYSELSDRKEDLDRDRRKAEELEAEITDLERRRQEALAKIIECEEKCRAGVEPLAEEIGMVRDPEPPAEEPTPEGPPEAGEPDADEELEGRVVTEDAVEFIVRTLREHLPLPLFPEEVASGGTVPGMQDGGAEIRARADGTTTVARAGGEDDPRDVPTGDDPRDADDGDDPRDEPLPDNICGPDVTAAYVEALNRAFERIQQLSDDEKGLFDGAAFLYRNGTNIDQTPRALTLEGEDAGTRCPRGTCMQTFTLAGHCLSRHISNDIMYGFVAYLLDVPYSIAWSGAQTWDLLQYGGFDPQTSNAAYTLGWNLAGWMKAGRPMSEPALARHLETTRLVEAGMFGADLVSLIEIVHRDESYVLQCAPCPEPCTSDFTKDFSKTTWVLEDGSRVEYEP